MVSNKFYKTDIGKIPVGWKPFKVGELVTFSGGSQPDKSTFKFRNTSDYIRLIQIRDYKTSKYETYIPEKLARKICDENDVMIGRYGPPIFQILRGIKGAYNVALIKASPSEKLNKDFFYHFIKNENLFSLMDALSRRSSGQTGVELPALREYPLPLPNLEEQTAIANALSDVDNLIISIDKLIDKKRAIKTATMQQLLTGKKRLPPFDKTHTGYKQTELGEIPEDWELSKLEYLINFTNGAAHENCIVFDGNYTVVNSKFISTEGVVAKHSNQLLCSTKINNILMVMSDVPNGKAIAKCFFVDEEDKYTVNQRICSMEVKSNDPKYIFYLLNRNKYYLQFDDGVKQTNLRRQDVLDCPVQLPSVDEQKAISQTLTEMEDDISVLEQRFNKTKQIKQGMMQELLTGRTRLI